MNDIVNAGFELLASLFILNHCRVLYQDKQVRGVSVLSSLFFTLWGLWNLYFYPAVNQSYSFYAGICVVVANAIYVAMLHYYDSQTIQYEGNEMDLDIDLIGGLR